ncbi:nucleotidyltransferase family protein [Pseudoflavonifractor phocaeensis]|uniref:tRNA(Met) cytidine acetate ligase n=1 Tax=Pseudoflavonifractor phocaeensis TaxID=1870988 RepID=UPI00195AF728|nr:nucleotidyltransferase family protein [Pseudoflavonifractor phocaeensis]MBM6723761.1 nucleotidyltransferase family protein [Pseudoflavonifractor phocaeensis]
MAVAGIVAEYNPFHLGHAYHLAQTRAALGRDGAVVCVMSGHWVQRGECAAADKWTRSALALAGGADLVLELPTPWAMASAEAFARGAVGLLEATGVVDILSFGSENGSLEALRQAADALDAPGYPARLREALGRGLSFPAARQAAADCPCLSTPNNNLGVEYLRALRALGSAMAPMTVARRGAGHDSTGNMEGFASASHIRALLREGRREEAAALLPDGSLEALGQPASLLWAERAVLARLRTMEEADWAALPDGGGAEGLPARLVRAARQALTLAEFYTLAKTRRYTHARLRRLAVGAFLGLTQEDRQLAVPYVRVLGLNERGQALLKRMKGTCALPILTKPAQARALDGPARRLFEAESRYTDLYGLCFPTPKPCGLEYTTSPVLSAAAGGGAPRR